MGLLGNFGTSLTLLLAYSSLLRAHREHKVHNIVLYPDKESWCKTTPIKQVVTWPQCSSQELDNNVCVGACFSYMVPHSEPSAPGDLIRPYCDSCQPLDSIWHTVTLDCKDKDDNPTTMQKKVQIITNCSCSSCMESSRIKPDLNSLLQSLELESARMAGGHHLHPQHHHHHHQQQQQSLQHQQQQQQQQQQFDGSGLLDATGSGTLEYSGGPSSASAAVAGAASPTAALQSQTAGSGVGDNGAETLVAVAPVLPHSAASTGNQNESSAIPMGSQVPRVSEGQLHETPDLLLNPNLNGSSKAAPAAPSATGHAAGKAHERFFQLFKQLNDPSLADDKLAKLAKLASLEKLEKLEKLATEYAGAKELLAKLSELLHKYSNQDEQLNGEGAEEEDEDAGGDSTGEEQLLQLLPSSTTPSSAAVAPAAAVPDPLPELKKDEDDEEVPSLQDQQLRVAASLLHRTGPHHSLVLDAGVKEKIDVESHYLHPALAGQEISYHDNVLLDKTKKKDF